ncbi:hypothetical protein GOV14_07020 [Candidatus Pacearchaeota archaeon]|nr:hypothetical protein [Candidatus Pacearchaeota archaeon]
MLECLIAMDSLAKKDYKKDITTYQNFEIIKKIKKIIKDKDQHISTLRELIKTLKH